MTFFFLVGVMTKLYIYRLITLHSTIHDVRSIRDVAAYALVRFANHVDIYIHIYILCFLFDWYDQYYNFRDFCFQILVN